MNSINKKEIEKFSRIAEEWWNPDGKFKPLHNFNPIRIKYIKENIIKDFKIKDLDKPLKNIKLLDIGCGGGLLSEPMRRLGADVTAIDASKQNIEVAKFHAKKNKLKIDYKVSSPEKLKTTNKFDVILNMEIVEHVNDINFFIKESSKLLKKNHYALIQKLNPSGLLKNAYFSFAKHKGGDAWAGCGQLDGFANEALDNMPAIKNFSSRGCSSKAEGWLDVNTRKGSVYFKKLFRDPLLVDALSGRLAWSYDSGGWRLMSDEIKLETPHIATTTRFSSVIPAEGKPVLLELESNFGAADAIHTSKYLPVGIMGDGAVGWLDSAFKGGQTTGGGVLLKGALKDFPFKNKEGLFQVLFNTKQVNLHYADGWPKLLDVAAEVEFKNEGMTIVSSKGAVAGNAIQHAKIQVPDLAKDRYLSVSGVIKDKLPGLYDFFRQSPLKQSVDGLTEHSEVFGLADVTLDIKIPLRKGLKADVKARASIRDGKLTFPELGESVTSLNGEVLYAAQGLSATSIKGKVLGESVLIDIYSDQKNTIISAKGNIKTKTLAAKYPSNVWANISGKSTAQLTVKVPRDGLSTNSAAVLSLESNLDGISIDYPEPVGKALNDVSYLNIKTVLGESPIRVDVGYRGKINSVFVFNQDKNKPLSLSKAGINFGQMPLAVPTHSGIKISGQINELNVPSWQKALGDVNYGENDNNKGVNSIDVHIDKIVWSDKTYKDVTLKASRKRSAWQGQVKNQLLDSYFNHNLEIQKGYKNHVKHIYDTLRQELTNDNQLLVLKTKIGIWLLTINDIENNQYWHNKSTANWRYSSTLTNLSKR